MKIAKQIRWNVETAAREFGINPRTLANALTKNGTRASDDGMFSTAQICAAVFSDYDQERTRLTRAQADQAELDLAIARNEVLPVEVAFQACSNVLFAALRIFEMNEKLTDAEKDELRREIQSFRPESIVAEKKFEEGT